MKHELNSVWKDREGWRLQGQTGILTFKTKNEAMTWALVFDRAVKALKTRKAGPLVGIGPVDGEGLAGARAVQPEGFSGNPGRGV